MPRTSFVMKFDEKDKPVTLYCVISPDNPKQHGAYLGEFIRFLNEQAQANKDIAKIIFIDGSYLKRHYQPKYADHKNQSLLFERRNRDKKYLDILVIPHEVISWHDVVVNPAYKGLHERITRDYASGDDTEFRAIVDEVVAQFMTKGTSKQTVPCLLDECIGAVTLRAMFPGAYETYPGVLNTAIQYIIKKYGHELKFVPYKLDESRAVAAAIEVADVPGTSHTSPIKLPFFGATKKYSGVQEPSPALFPNQMVFTKGNHVWQVRFEIQFDDESGKDIHQAIDALIANVEAAKSDYMKKRTEHHRPVTLEYKNHFIGYMISWMVRLENSEVVKTVKPDPFNILIGAATLEKSSYTSVPQPQLGAPTTIGKT